MASSAEKASSSKSSVVNKQASKGIDVRELSFHSEGIEAFVDWITDVGNYRQSEQRLEHTHREVAYYINSKHGTKWDRRKIGKTLEFVKKRYYQAKKILTSAGQGGNIETATITLRKKVLKVCPPFEKLGTVFGTPFERLHLPPVNTLPPQLGEPANSRALLPPNMVDLDDTDDMEPTMDETTSHSPRRSRRQKMKRTVIATSSKGAVVNKRASKEEVVTNKPFDAEGIDTLVDWIADAGHYEPSTYKRSLFGRKKLAHSHRNIASYINSIHGTKWNHDTVSGRLKWLKMMYGRAKEILTSAGEGGNTGTDATLHDEVLTVCPPFERLHTAFGTPFKRLQAEGPVSARTEDGEAANSRIPSPHDDDPAEDEAESHLPRRSKRRKTEKTAVTTSQDHIRQTMQVSDRQYIPMDDVIGDIRRRQDVLESREKDLTDRLLETERKHHEMLMKREEQHMGMLMRMEEQQRERLRNRERHHRKSLRKREKEHREHHQRQWERRLRELEDEKAELKEEKAQFKKERDGMLQDMAAMKKELQLRNYAM